MKFDLLNPIKRKFFPEGEWFVDCSRHCSGSYLNPGLVNSFSADLLNIPTNILVYEGERYDVPLCNARGCPLAGNEIKNNTNQNASIDDLRICKFHAEQRGIKIV